MIEATLRCKQAALNGVTHGGTHGVTLIELAMSMMIIVVLSVGVASLMRVGIEAQLAERVNQKMQIISMSIVDDLRRDLQMAQDVTVQNGGNTLLVSVPRPTNPAQTYNATYKWMNGRFSREANGATKIYNDIASDSSLRVNCVNGSNVSVNCFRWVNAGRTVLGVSGLRVEHTGFGNTVFDQQFGAPNYTVRDLTFDISIYRTFQ
jgi:type II secretory pathway pseudopilin PulG